jgi:hypothetical protein
MITLKVTLLAAGLAMLPACALVASAGDAVADKAVGQALKFDVYDGYFVSNKFEPNAPTSFVVIQDQKRFDEVFGVGMVMGDRSHRLAAGTFDSQIVVSAIRRGRVFWGFKVQDVKVADGVVTLRYTASGTPQPSAEYACPLIVSIPKGAYKSVQFVENDKPVGKVDLAPAAKPAEK